MHVYCIKNTVNGKLYVGQTVQLIRTRWSNHVSASRNPETAINFAIAKYGAENFEISILEECQDKESLDKAEIRWIAKLGTLGLNGYNMTAGGFGGQLDPPEETRRRLHSASLGRKRTAETKARLSTIAAQRDRSDVNQFAQTVLAYNGKGIVVGQYRSYTAAAEATGKAVRTVQRCAELRCGTRDRRWFFLPAGLVEGNLTEEFMMEAAFRGVHRGRRDQTRLLKNRGTTIQIEQNGERLSYPSISAAARFLGVHPMRVKRAMGPRSLETKFKVIP